MALVLEQFTQLTGETNFVPLQGRRIWLRAHCDFLTEKAQFRYSSDGKNFVPLGKAFTTLFSNPDFSRRSLLPVQFQHGGHERRLRRL